MTVDRSDAVFDDWNGSTHSTGSTDSSESRRPSPSDGPDRWAGSAALKIAIVGPTHPHQEAVAVHTRMLAHQLADAGHDVSLVSWAQLYPSPLQPAEATVPPAVPEVPPYPRTVRALSWTRPDTWIRTGRRLRDVDAIIVVHVRPPVVPAHLALLRAAGACPGSGGGIGTGFRPRSVVVCHPVLPHEPHVGDRSLMSWFFRHVDSTLVHTTDEAQVARSLGATRVLVADLPPHLSEQVRDGVNGLLGPPGDERARAGALRRRGDPEAREGLAEGVQTRDLSAVWASYLGAIETLSVDAAALAAMPEPEDAGPFDQPGAGRARGAQLAGRLADTGRWLRRAARDGPASRRSVLTLSRADLPGWVLPTDVLVEPQDANDAKRLARSVGLPRSVDGVATWAALGALSAVIRVRDDGRRSAVIIDESGPRSLLTRWARAVGFAPVQIDFTGSRPDVVALDVDTGSLDVIARIHPHGCDRDEVDHVLEQAAWALRSGGLLIITIPIGPIGAEGAVGPADVRGIIARAHALGFVLVGDLDGDLNTRMREASGRARAGDTAYGLVRLTLRRR